MSHKPLFLLQLRLSVRDLFVFGKQRGFLQQATLDLGYLVHCWLKESFGDDAPKPFSIVREQGAYADVLAYSHRNKADLYAHAQRFSSPEVFQLCEWEKFFSKELPLQWPAQLKVGFQLRACPVARFSSATDRHKEGAEADVFLARCWESPGVDLSREKIYTEWLAAQLERQGGATLIRAELQSFQRSRLFRRTQGTERQAHLTERPDVTFSGVLAVKDSNLFSALLARGVGRHRAFGFGLLVLRSA
jgi:CRISPR system Cascade subunit CasE